MQNKFLSPLRQGWQRATVDFEVRVKRVGSSTLEVCADFSYESQQYDLNYAYLEEILLTKEVLEQLVPVEHLIESLQASDARRSPKDRVDEDGY